MQRRWKSLPLLDRAPEQACLSEFALRPGRLTDYATTWDSEVPTVLKMLVQYYCKMKKVLFGSSMYLQTQTTVNRRASKVHRRPDELDASDACLRFKIVSAWNQ